FWTALAAPLWNQAARQAAVQKGSSVVENARLFALLNMAGTDSFIPCWHLKFKHNFWRPIHAIRHAESADNRAVSADPAWEPLIVTPPFPEYVSGHTAWAGTSEKILQTFFGSDEINLTVTNPAVGITRRYSSFSQMAQEVNDARVWGGVHYRISDERGLELGRRVAEYCLKNFLLPISRVLQN
ncbi:MAG: vanadium-dependent haloperoxidase, partial [Burkholderiales bacterium]